MKMKMGYLLCALVLLFGLSACKSQEEKDKEQEEKSSALYKKEQDKERAIYSSLPSLSKDEAEREALFALQQFYLDLSEENEEALKKDMKNFYDWDNSRPPTPKELLNDYGYGGRDFSQYNSIEVIPKSQWSYTFKKQYKVEEKYNAVFLIFTKYDNGEGDTLSFINMLGRDEKSGKFSMWDMQLLEKDTFVTDLNEKAEALYKKKATQPFLIESSTDYSKDDNYVSDKTAIDLIEFLNKNYPQKVGPQANKVKRLGADQLYLQTNQGTFRLNIREDAENVMWQLLDYHSSQEVLKSNGW